MQRCGALAGAEKKVQGLELGFYREGKGGKAVAEVQWARRRRLRFRFKGHLKEGGNGRGVKGIDDSGASIAP
jgi:hypothetical protein